MVILYDGKGIAILEENEYVYFVDRCLFCKKFTEEPLINDWARQGYCAELKLKISDAGICKKFLGL